jgi:hypothetical protein
MMDPDTMAFNGKPAMLRDLRSALDIAMKGGKRALLARFKTVWKRRFCSGNQTRRWTLA